MNKDELDRKIFWFQPYDVGGNLKKKIIIS